MVVVVDDEVVVELVGAGPVDTTIVTDDPFAAFELATGFVLITLPAGTVDDDCCWVTTLNPA